jgi:HK97 family phage prohead protease
MTRLAHREQVRMHRLDAGGTLSIREDARDGSGDADGRTIEGVAVPYRVPTIAGATRELGPNVREQFAPGAFRDAIEALNGRRVALLDRHQGTVVGAAELEDAEDGLHYRGRLFTSQAARDMAERVAAGINGVSIEFAFGRMRRIARDLVEHVSVGALGAIASTYAPAYAGAIASVREVSRMDHCPVCGAELELGIAHECNPTAAQRDQAIRREAVGELPLTSAQVTELAARAADEAFRRHLEGSSGSGGTDPFADLRGFRSLGDMILAAAQDGAPAELRSYAARALADQLTTDNNAGVMTPGVLATVRGILDRGRRSITAFGGPRSLGEVGMSIEWPYFDGTLSSLVGVQATQKSEITSAKVEIKKGTEAIVTYAGGSDIAYQLIRRSSPSYLEVYGRILLAAWGLVTNAAFVTELETGTQTVDLAEAIATVDADELWAALVAAAVQVETATGQPPEFVLAGSAFFARAAVLLKPQPVQNAIGSVNLATLTAAVGNLPILHDPSITTGKAIVSNREAAGWHEAGPFQASEEDVAKLGRNVAYWSMGAGARYLPAGIVEVYDVTP